jgi:hypothetical protein
MRSRLLVRHFLSQFVENELSPDVDRHQVLALTAAALITLPLFVTVFMGVKYLMRPLQAPGWTQITAIGDQMTFCAASMLVSAIVATIEWDALALSRRDAMILGVMPIPRRDIVRAKVVSLVTFAAAFVVALNALPAVLHPPLMTANLPMSPLLLVPLIVVHGLGTMMAGAFGFAAVLAIRESLYLSLGRRVFGRISGFIRSGLLFSLLVLLAFVPVRVAGRADWVLQPAGGPVLQRPVSWFAATHTAIAGRLLDRLPGPDLPTWMAIEEDRLRADYRRGLPHVTALALRGAGALVVLLVVSSTMYLWNARRLQVLPEEEGGAATFRIRRLAAGIAQALIRRPARRAGLLFFARTLFGSPVHRAYLITSAAAGTALLIAMAPAASRTASAPIRHSQVAAQTLMLTAIVAGFRAAVRTSSDPSATWLFGVTDTGHFAAFRDGVRVGVIAAIAAVVLLLAPLHTAAWGVRVASLHAVNGVILGWLLVEVACASVEQPLVSTIPPNDGLNTVGAVFLGAIVIGVFVLARIERAALATTGKSATFAAVLILVAVVVRQINLKSHPIPAAVRVPHP